MTQITSVTINKNRPSFTTLGLILLILSSLLVGFTTKPNRDEDQTIAQQQNQLIIDFEWLNMVPVDLHPVIIAAVEKNRGRLPDVDRWTVSSFRQTDEWGKAILVPTVVIEAGWEHEAALDHVLTVILHLEDEQWSAYLENDPDFSEVRSAVPQRFGNFTEQGPMPRSHNLRFPWTSGSEWQKTQGWHQGNAIDFRPVNPINDAVIAAEGGVVTLVCGGPGSNDPDQAMFRITHHDGETTGYLHLDANSIKPDIDGQTIPSGWYLGDLYDGNAQTANTCPDGWNCQYATPCGYGTGPHLHFTISDQNDTVDGNNINTVANAASGTNYLSSNPRIDACVPPNSGDWIINQDCIFCGADSAPADVVVQNGATLTLFPNADLNIDFVNRNLRVSNGSGVRIIDSARIR